MLYKEDKILLEGMLDKEIAKSGGGKAGGWGEGKAQSATPVHVFASADAQSLSLWSSQAQPSPRAIWPRTT